MDLISDENQSWISGYNLEGPLFCKGILLTLKNRYFYQMPYMTRKSQRWKLFRTHIPIWNHLLMHTLRHSAHDKLSGILKTNNNGVTIICRTEDKGTLRSPDISLELSFQLNPYTMRLSYISSVIKYRHWYQAWYALLDTRAFPMFCSSECVKWGSSAKLETPSLRKCLSPFRWCMFTQWCSSDKKQMMNIYKLRFSGSD